MDPAGVVAFPRQSTLPGRDPDADAPDAGDVALAEIDAAIALVAGRAARRVRITAMPFLETVAGLGLVHARAAGMAFTFERPERAGVVTVTIGPLAPDVPS